MIVFTHSFISVSIPFFFSMCAEAVLAADSVSGGEPVHRGGGAVHSRSFLQLLTERAEGR